MNRTELPTVLFNSVPDASGRIEYRLPDAVSSHIGVMRSTGLMVKVGQPAPVAICERIGEALVCVRVRF